MLFPNLQRHNDFGEIDSSISADGVRFEFDEQGGQTNLPFNVKWQAGNGSINNGDECGYDCGYNGFSFSSPNASVSMSTYTSHGCESTGETYESNETGHRGRGYYGYYLYSGSAPSSHIPNGSVPSEPSEGGNTDALVLRIITKGNPNFSNYAYVDVNAYLPKPPEAVPQVSDPPEADNSWENFAWGFGVTGPYEVLAGLYNVAMHPVQAAKGIANAVMHPVQTSKAIYQEVKEKAGTSQGRGELAFDVATALLSYIKIGKAAKIANAVDNVSDTAGASKTIANAGKQAAKTEGYCFTAGTQVVVGVIYNEEDCTVIYVTANIESIKVGDYVLAQDVETGEVSLKDVTNTFVRTSDHIRYLTTIDEEGDEQVIETTDSHPFWVVTDSPDLSRAAQDVVVENGTTLIHENLAVAEHGYYVEAKDLQVGDVFIGANGELTTLTGTERVEYPNGITVYNFTVADNHNYFIVGTLEAYENGASVVLVHNACHNNGMTETPHGGQAHDQAINDYISKLLKREKITDIRKHQVQVDVNGNRVGNNKPDIQFDYERPNGTKIHINVELDHIKANSLKHRMTILQNDPLSKIFTHILR
ncbi:hypothetical protein FACS18942_07570 [Planctomycetales bacterium]|nr:hypothetical protein FACS18942_07570 [Planctomycetales bacterium]